LFPFISPCLVVAVIIIVYGQQKSIFKISKYGEKKRYVIFLHLPIGETRFRQGVLLYSQYNTFSFIICVLESRVWEATASVRRAQLLWSGVRAQN
jgi:hypothetical protein